MKKSILFILSCIPLFASCNNNSNGFPNPFPDDDYHPYGFIIREDESISRSLTTTEQTLVNSSIDKKNDIYVKQHKSTTQTRDYTRAFAGEFEQGYASSNIKRTEESITFRQEEDSSATPNPLKRRTVTKNHLDTIYDYSYGRNTSKVDTTEWHYYAKGTHDDVKHETEYEEVPNEGTAEYVFSQIKSTESSTNVGAILATKSGGTWDHEPDEVFTDGLIHSEFLTPLAKCSSASTGADKKDNVILVKVEQNKYKDPTGKVSEEGIYELPDGRRYQAMENSLTVSRLELKKAIATGPSKTDWETDWYLVSYARKYTEITITSKIIQPNVPIEMLTDPIVIHYTEEEHTFSVDDPTEKSDEDIKEITIKDEK